jgi:glycosyltransferase involved in cell wall biosynthesis
MKLTVIVPTYNRAAFLPYALKSIVLQKDAADLDVLVVDDGSTDATGDVLAEMCAAEPCIRVIATENRGVAAARNVGLTNLLDETELVTFLDSDDLMPQGRIAADIVHFLSDATLDMTYGRMLMVEDFNYGMLCPTPESRRADIRSIHLASGLYRRGFLDKVGLIDERFVQAEDTDYILRLFDALPNYTLTETCCLYYLRHQGNMTRRHAESRKYFMLALHKSVQRRRANPLLGARKLEFDVKALGEVDIY